LVFLYWIVEKQQRGTTDLPSFLKCMNQKSLTGCESSVVIGKELEVGDLSHSATELLQ
jgi:hypothetical protein